jgi:hypothetical protein
MHQEDSTLFLIILMYLCESALEAGRASTHAAQNKNEKRLAFTC